MEAMSRNTVLPSGAGMPGRVWSSGQITRVILAEESGTLRPSIAAALGLQQAVAIPLRGYETTLGVVTLFSCRKDGSNHTADLDELAKIGAEIGRLYEAKRAEDALNEEERLAKLREEIAKAVTGGGSLQLALQESADAISKHLDAVHVRIWTFRANLNLLELQAYGGIAPDAEIPDSQIPVGSTRIGIIAQQRRPFTSNSVASQSSLCDPEWVHRNGIVSFAGYPLIVGELLVGVLALFFRQPPRKSVSRAIPSVVDAIALGIRGKGAEAALRQNEEFLQRIIDSTHDGILVMNVNGRLQYVSPGGQSLMEIGDNSITELNWSDLWKGPQEQQAIEAFEDAKTGQMRIFHSYSPTSAGTPKWWDVSISPIRDTAGQVSQLVAVVRDITERKRLESQLAQAQKLESIGQLAAGIAHEINTPVQYVGDNARFLETAFADFTRHLRAVDDLVAAARELGAAPAQVEQLEQVANEVDLAYLCAEIPKAIHQSLDGLDRVATIVRAMKEFSHPGSTEKTSVDINGAIASTLVVSRNEWKYVAEIVEDYDPALPQVYCLAGELNQVILNLVVNAAHAIAEVAKERAGGKGTITISTRRDGDCVEIRVRDNGAGIPEAVRPNVFNPFFTTKPVGKGSGQGLAIAHNVIVQRHGGTITFESEVGSGTVFIIRLPINGG
jgi:PAS domain S-box-containing protein